LIASFRAQATEDLELTRKTTLKRHNVCTH
jgi:hypothetical protein